MNNSTTSFDNNQDQVRIEFGSLNQFNLFWTQLLEDMVAWKRNHRDSEWPTSKVFARNYELYQIFDKSEFRTRYDKAKQLLEGKLGIFIFNKTNEFKILDMSSQFFLFYSNKTASQNLSSCGIWWQSWTGAVDRGLEGDRNEEGDRLKNRKKNE